MSYSQCELFILLKFKSLRWRKWHAIQFSDALVVLLHNTTFIKWGVKWRTVQQRFLLTLDFHVIHTCLRTSVPQRTFKRVITQTDIVSQHCISLNCVGGDYSSRVGMDRNEVLVRRRLLRCMTEKIQRRRHPWNSWSGYDSRSERSIDWLVGNEGMLTTLQKSVESFWPVFLLPRGTALLRSLFIYL